MLFSVSISVKFEEAMDRLKTELSKLCKCAGDCNIDDVAVTYESLVERLSGLGVNDEAVVFRRPPDADDDFFECVAGAVCDKCQCELLRLKLMETINVHERHHYETASLVYGIRD